MPATEAQVKLKYRGILEREADPGGLANYIGKNGYFIDEDMMNSQERKNLEVRRASQNAELARIQALVNEQNVALTKLSEEKKISAAEKAALLSQIADCNAEIAAAHDTIKDLQDNPDTKLLDEGKGLFDWVRRLIERLKK